VACSDEASSGATPETTPGGPSGDAGAPLYAVQYSVPNTSDGFDAYVNLVSSIDTGTLDRARGIELTGGGFLSGTPSMPSSIFAASAENPTVTRYDIAADGVTLTKGPTLSFAGQGLTEAPRYQANMIFASPQKAYAFDVRSAQVIVWNPTEMTITRVIPVEGLTRTGFNTLDSFGSVVRDGVAAIPTSWSNFAAAQASSESAVTLIDTRTDTVTVQTLTDCGGLRAAYLTAGGDVVVSGSSGAHVTLHRVRSSPATEPCVLRLGPGPLDFRSAVRAKSSSLAGGRVVADVTPAGDQLVFQAFDESLFPVTATTTSGDIFGAPAWPFAKAPQSAVGASAEYTAIPGLPVGRISSLRILVDKRTFIQVSQADGRSQLYDVTDPAAPRAALTSPGLFDHIVRLR